MPLGCRGCFPGSCAVGLLAGSEGRAWRGSTVDGLGAAREGTGSKEENVPERNDSEGWEAFGFGARVPSACQGLALAGCVGYAIAAHSFSPPLRWGSQPEGPCPDPPLPTRRGLLPAAWRAACPSCWGDGAQPHEALLSPAHPSDRWSCCTAQSSETPAFWDLAQLLGPMAPRPGLAPRPGCTEPCERCLPLLHPQPHPLFMPPLPTLLPASPSPSPSWFLSSHANLSPCLFLRSQGHVKGSGGKGVGKLSSVLPCGPT